LNITFTSEWLSILTHSSILWSGYEVIVAAWKNSCAKSLSSSDFGFIELSSSRNCDDRSNTDPRSSHKRHTTSLIHDGRAVVTISLNLRLAL
uniref:Neur_chan_LBD domain-containing protein n=1 Tax=Haemonchus placei TaxID=6290 RepID=A0A158QKR5_HAEPC